MTAKDLEYACSKAFPNARVSVSDVAYNTPKISWLINEYGDWFLNFLRSMGVPSPIDLDNPDDFRLFDCDNYTAAFRSLAYFSHYSASNGIPTRKEGFGVGEFWYFDDELQGAHAINIVVNNGSSVQFEFIEPQTCKLKILNINEKNSAFDIRF